MIKYRKVTNHCHYTNEYKRDAHSICNLKHSVPREITVIFHSGSNYDCHYIIKELAEKREKN